MKEYIERAQLLKNLGYDEKRRADVLPGSTFDIVLKEPTADVAPVRHGRWIDSSNGWMCSECGQDNTYDKPWCPNCGARMNKKDYYESIESSSVDTVPVKHGTWVKAGRGADFDFMGFGYDGGSDEMLVVNANKYSAQETVNICKKEYEHLFNPRFGGTYKEPTIENVKSNYCAYRMGVSDIWPTGCYTLVDKPGRGAFPVHVIYFGKLEHRE